MTNLRGRLLAVGDSTIDTQGALLDNTAGRINAQATLTLNTGDLFNGAQATQAGLIGSNGDLSIHAGVATNGADGATQSNIWSAQTARLSTQSFTNAGVLSGSGGNMAIAGGLDATLAATGDGLKIGGTRADLDLLCGAGGARCSFVTNPDGSIDTSKPITFKEDYAEFLKSADGQKMLSAPFGGLQGGERTLFGQTYAKGSWQDKLVEAFAGPHDLMGGKVSGLYDGQGNIKQGLSSSEIKAFDVWSAGALIPAAPFAISQVLSPEVWKVIGILLKAGQ